MDLIPTIRLERIDQLPLNLVFGYDAIQRFLRHIEIAENGCIHYKGKTDKDGYGQFSVYHNGFRYEIAASRWVAQFMNQGYLPKNLMARHKCDNPLCVNPYHIEPGTALDNCRDMWERGRAYAQKIAQKTS